MILTRESRRAWWLIMAGAWLVAVVFAVLHVQAMLGYTGMLDRAALRGPEPTTVMKHVVPTNYADAQTWVRYALTFENDVPWQVRYTYNDNAPAGRDVHWSSGFAHLVYAGGKLRQMFTHEPTSLAIERMLPWFNLPLFVVVMVGLSAWIGRRAGAGAGVLTALGFIGMEAFYSGFSPHYVDHHGILTAATFGVVMGAVLMGGGWWQAESESTAHLLPTSWEAARNAAILSGVAGGIGMWFSAASTIPAIALAGAGGLIATWFHGRSAQRDGAHFEADLWRLWGRVGAGTSALFYLIEYAPHHLGFRLEVNHPLYALAWLGGAEIVALLCEYSLATKTVMRRPPAWRFAWPLLAVLAAPLTIFFGGMKVFVVSDPFIAEIPKTVAEGMPINLIMKAYGNQALYQYVNWNVIPFILATVLLCLRRQREKHLILFAALVAVAFFAMTLMQIRWASGASGPHLCLLVVVLTALLNNRKLLVRSAASATLLVGGRFIAEARQRVRLFRAAAGLFSHRNLRLRWLMVLIIVGACFVPPAVTRINFINRTVAARVPDRMDLQQLLYRDVAMLIRNSQPTGDITLLASPNGSCGIGYYGNFKTIGTLYWENYAGMRAAAEIFSASSEDKARELIKTHGITHLAMISEESFLKQFFKILNPTGTDDEFKKTFGYRLLVDMALPSWLRPIPYSPPGDIRSQNWRVILLQVVPPQSDRDAYWHIALAQLALGESENTAKTFEAAIRLSPPAEQLSLCVTAANTCYNNGVPAAAARLYRAALTAGPNPTVACNLAWVLATCRDDGVRNGPEALAIAQSLDANDPTTQSALAAAFAELGNFAEAVNAATKALELIRPLGNKATESQFANRLETYKSGRPMRQ
jgi:tetratricopeptide (TPR) repeat protein